MVKNHHQAKESALHLNDAGHQELPKPEAFFTGMKD
jgi:hypothetical protein